ncbi:MAG TPA: two-component regulator propeller domain-containing protein, partial [Chryseosolibacter sp.]|nr:two-component regulator propeller domain-containing protein [Chryseosolibacter sp.]
MRAACVAACLFAVVMCHAAAWAQEIRLDRLTASEGLSSNSVYTVFQDVEGVLWLGTLDGLNRYDGYAITVFKHDKLRKGSIANNRITRIYQDRQRQLWLYDEYTSILVKYTPASEEFETYYLATIAGGELEMLDSLYEDANGNLRLDSWLGWKLQYNPKKKTFDVLQGKDAQPRADRINRRSWPGILEPFDAYLSEVKSPFNVANIGVRDILKDSQGRYWIATSYDGLYTAVLSDGQLAFTRHLQHPLPGTRVNSTEILGLFEDESQVVWACTRNDGVYRYSPHKYKFRSIESVGLKSRTFVLGTVRAIAEDTRRNLWVGTNERGLLRIDSSRTSGELYMPSAGNPDAIGHHFIRSIYIDRDQNLWVGHYRGFSKYNYSRNTFTAYMPPVNFGEDVRVYDFKEDAHHTLWMAGWDAILSFNRSTNKIEYISSRHETEKNLQTENLRELEMDTQGELWIAAGEKGMSVYDKRTQTFTTNRYDPTLTNGLPTNNIFDVLRDKNGNIWIATADGLCRFDPSASTCETFTSNDGLPTNLIFGITEDNGGYLWLTTTKGLSRFDPGSKAFRNYDVSDGLPSNEFSENAFYRSHDGTLFM